MFVFDWLVLLCLVMVIRWFWLSVGGLCCLLVGCLVMFVIIVLV